MWFKKVRELETDWMREALLFASHTQIDLPIAALLIDVDGQEVCRARNSVEQLDDITAHAEVLVLREVGLRVLKTIGWRLTLVVTLEPCPMCAWAIRSARIGRVIYGARNQHYGSAGSVTDLLRSGRAMAPVEVIGGVLENECNDSLGKFFRKVRNN